MWNFQEPTENARHIAVQHAQPVVAPSARDSPDLKSEADARYGL